jgi:hypothetical protein
MSISGHKKQHLDNLRRKDALRGAETAEISVRLGNYSASHFEGSAKTHSVFDRYNVSSERNIEDALQKAHEYCLLQQQLHSPQENTVNH